MIGEIALAVAVSVAGSQFDGDLGTANRSRERSYASEINFERFANKAASDITSEVQLAQSSDDPKIPDIVETAWNCHGKIFCEMYDRANVDRRTGKPKVLTFTPQELESKGCTEDKSQSCPEDE